MLDACQGLNERCRLTAFEGLLIRALNMKGEEAQRAAIECAHEDFRDVDFTGLILPLRKKCETLCPKTFKQSAKQESAVTPAEAAAHPI